MRKYLYLFFFITSFFNGFSQRDSSLIKTIGFNGSIFFQDYGLFYSQQFSPNCSYTIQLGYPLINVNPNRFGVRGISTSALFEYKTKNLKNYPYVTIGFHYKYKEIDSIVNHDQISESYAYKNAFYSIKTGWGYNWNVHRISISFLLGFYSGWQKTVYSNYHLIYSDDENYTVPTGETIKEQFSPCIPLLDFSIGYKF